MGGFREALSRILGLGVEVVFQHRERVIFVEVVPLRLEVVDLPLLLHGGSDDAVNSVDRVYHVRLPLHWMNRRLSLLRGRLLAYFFQVNAFAAPAFLLLRSAINLVSELANGFAAIVAIRLLRGSLLLQRTIRHLFFGFRSLD